MSNFHFCYSVLWHVVLRAEDRLGIKDKSTVTGASQHGDTATSDCRFIDYVIEMDLSGA